MGVVELSVAEVNALIILITRKPCNSRLVYPSPVATEGAEN